MNNRIEIDLGFAKLVAERGGDTSYNEIYIGLEHKDGVWQDIAVVRQAYDVDDDWNVIQKEKAEVLVYADEYDEDYTHKFEIGTYRDECEDDLQ